MITVNILPRAEHDILELPEKLQDEIIYKLELLEQFPEMGMPMEKAFLGYRFILAGKRRYRIIYKYLKSSKIVHITYIRHCRRQIGLRIT